MITTFVLCFFSCFKLAIFAIQEKKNLVAVNQNSVLAAIAMLKICFNLHSLKHRGQ